MELLVLMTMDVEPLKTVSAWTGPETAGESARTAIAYRELAAVHGFPVSCFIHPEAAALHRDMLLDWHRQGASLGLHIHTTKFHYPEYRFEFGAYDANAQRAILARGREEWEEALGLPCQTFRPGAFSANDATMPVLAELGFRGGSVSIPGRIWPGRYCVWSGAEPDPHRGHAAFRLVPGELPFANIPLSVSPSHAITRPGLEFRLDLRPTLVEPSVAEILEDIIQGLAQRHPAVPVLHVVAHNDQPFDDPDSAPGGRCRALLAAITPLAARYGFTAIGATVDQVCDRVLALPVASPTEWLADNDVR